VHCAAPGLPLALLLLAGCAGGAPRSAVDSRPLLALEPRIGLVLQPAPGDGPARVVRVTVRIATADGVPLRVVACGPPESAGLLELSVRWQDFRGDGPVASGRSSQVLVPWSGEGLATAEAPCERTAEVSLSVTEGVLARRVQVEGRLIGVDFERDDGHSGGRLLSLPRAALDSLAPAPAGLLDEHLQSGRPDGIFLAAAGAPPEWRSMVLDRLVSALPASRGKAREAIFAALLWLTGETHGRDVHRWSAWWSDERNKAR